MRPYKSRTSVYCGQKAGWIKLPLRMEVCDIVLDGDSAEEAQQLPSTFRPSWPNGWIGQDITWYEDASAQAISC